MKLWSIFSNGQFGEELALRQPTERRPPKSSNSRFLILYRDDRFGVGSPNRERSFVQMCCSKASGQIERQIWFANWILLPSRS